MNIRQNIKKNFLKLFVIQLLFLGLLAIAPPSAYAATAAAKSPAVSSTVNQATAIKPEGLPNVTAGQDNVKSILQVVFGIIGSFALLSITLSGLKYITSAGNPQKVSEAKNGIVYSLVGLIIAISAEAIVAFVVKRAV